MIKITKRLFFYAAFLLCAVLVFAADNSKTTDRPAIRVYDAKGFLVSEARIPSILHVFGKVMDVYAGDANDHQFSGSILPERSVHEGKQLLYRYTIWAFRDEPIRIYVYSDTDKVVLTNSFPDWVDCTLTKEGYELFSNPKRLIDRLNRVAIELMDIR